jgi:hypothetical protein
MSQDSPAALRLLADCCRKQAKGASRGGVADCLNEMALDYDRKAERADAEAAGTRPVPPKA